MVGNTSFCTLTLYRILEGLISNSPSCEQLIPNSSSFGDCSLRPCDASKSTLHGKGYLTGGNRERKNRNGYIDVQFYKIGDLSAWLCGLRQLAHALYPCPKNGGNYTIKALQRNPDRMLRDSPKCRVPGRSLPSIHSQAQPISPSILFSHKYITKMSSTMPWKLSFSLHASA